VLKKKSLTNCDGQALKAEIKSLPALYSATAFQSQTKFLARRLGAADPATLAAIACLCFGEARS
jgi:hypothetical protein